MGKKTEFLYLNEQEMIKAGVLDSAHCVEVLDEMFRLLGKGDYLMGGRKMNEHGIRIFFPEKTDFPNMPVAGPDRRFMAMVGYLGGRFNICGEKWYGSNIINPSRGLPRSVLMVMLNDPDTCEPIALMSGNLLSAVRTGSVPGVGTRYLARKDAKTCAIIGAGPVNKACFQGIRAEAKTLKEIVVYDLFPEKAQAFADWAKAEFGVHGQVGKSLEQTVCAGDIISVAASRLKPVELKNEWIKKGSLLILTGAAFIDDDYWTDAKIIYDNPKMHASYMAEAHDSSDVNAAYDLMIAGQVYRLIDAGRLPVLEGNEQAPHLGKIANKEQPGRISNDQRIAFITGGLPCEDLAWGFELYTKAKAMGLGTTLKLWDEAHWV